MQQAEIVTPPVAATALRIRMFECAVSRFQHALRFGAIFTECKLAYFAEDMQAGVG